MGEIRHRADQFTVLVRQVPLCPEHKTRGCGVDHFFSKHHPFSYHSYQMLYNGKDLEYLLVRFDCGRINFCNHGLVLFIRELLRVKF